MIGMLIIGCISLVLFASTFFLRTPFTAPFRPWDSVGIGALALLLTGFLSLGLVKKHPYRLVSISTLALLLFTLGIVAVKEFQFRETKHTILKPVQTPSEAKPLDPHTIGQHFIVGYRSVDEANALIDAGAIGGLFLSERNIRGKTVDQIREEVGAFQARERSHHRPPLFIATDQEGGIVSRLSPPLPFQPSVGSLVREKSPSEQIEFTHTYAASQAAALASVGVNLNFAPVVDRDTNIHDPNDRFSKISDRAIASDAATITSVAQQYVLTLSDLGILSTLKHFPGLGSVHGDSHVADVVVTSSKEELEKTDWQPFQSILPTTNALVMVAHAKTQAIDPANPASVSYPIIHDVLRGEMKIDNVIITDDFSMQPIFARPGSVGQATIDTLNAGTDLVLIAYDTDLLYEAEAAARTAYDEGTLDKTMMDASTKRLEEIRKFFSQHSHQ